MGNREAILRILLPHTFSKWSCIYYHSMMCELNRCPTKQFPIFLMRDCVIHIWSSTRKLSDLISRTGSDRNLRSRIRLNKIESGREIDSNEIDIEILNNPRVSVQSPIYYSIYPVTVVHYVYSTRSTIAWPARSLIILYFGSIYSISLRILRLSKKLEFVSKNTGKCLSNITKTTG